ncbi:hypothetical protein EAMG_03715 [Escherichia coli M056]|nr:conserved hypothetical protein [Escherichia coli H299]OMI55662.1 hypothetical protein MP35_15435 [Escherichia coli N40513]OSK25282.1 hypothetical protein EAMG_03715 [Escherichia coli M056]OSL25424.1 hypothetical protein ECQG_01535 [Escherichia coli TA255]OSL87171.1 hypothetical protein EAZG_01741 [Escherichia coli TA249]
MLLQPSGGVVHLITVFAVYEKNKIMYRYINIWL